ncbi:hypothetical protein CAPTEDRAFT_73011, partial [Capitella teleta]
RMREAEELVDVTLDFGGRHVKYHKVILAGKCDYFRHMFLTNMAEKASEEVAIEGIGANTGVLLIEYLYSGQIELSTHNAQDLLEASNMLLLGTLKKNVEDFLCRHTDATNCISLLNLSRMYDLEALLEGAQKYLHDHVKEVANTEEMHLLQEGDLVEILTANSPEEDKFRFLQKWVKSDERRTGDFVTLIQHVELSKCRKEFLNNTVMVERLMFNEQCMELLRQAMQTDPSQTQALAPPSEKQHYSGCASPDGFIISGGLRNNIAQRDCFSYDVQTNRWKTLPPMSTARVEHSSMCHENQLYVIGGWDGNNILYSVEVLDMNSLQWSYIPRLPFRVCKAGVVFFSNNLFVLGGMNDAGDWVTDVNEYDSLLRGWQRRSPMLHISKRASVVSFGDHIYIIGGHNRSCMQFNPIDDFWISLKRPYFKHYKGASLIWNDKILIYGGRDEDSIEEYSPLTNQWETLA